MAKWRGRGRLTPLAARSRRSRSPLTRLAHPRSMRSACRAESPPRATAMRWLDEARCAPGMSSHLAPLRVRLTTVRIGAGDTLAQLVASINRVIGASGRARVLKQDGAERIEVTAANGKALRLEAGPPGRDALAGLGLSPGVIARSAPGMKAFGLGLINADLKLDDKASIAKTKAELSAAVSIVRQAYEALLHPNAKEQTAEEIALAARRKAAGQPPEYLMRQLANYQAALARLGG